MRDIFRAGWAILNLPPHLPLKRKLAIPAIKFASHKNA